MIHLENGRIKDNFYQGIFMGMNIKNDEVHAMAQELAQLTGQNLTNAVKMAVEQTLAQVKASRGLPRSRPLGQRLNEIALRCASLPDDDSSAPRVRRSPDEILGYDASGLPS
jgi:antitoxin VapB